MHQMSRHALRSPRIMTGKAASASSKRMEPIYCTLWRDLTVGIVVDRDFCTASFKCPDAILVGPPDSEAAIESIIDAPAEINPATDRRSCGCGGSLAISAASRFRRRLHDITGTPYALPSGSTREIVVKEKPTRVEPTSIGAPRTATPHANSG